jgi:hypothetical protein
MEEAKIDVVAPPAPPRAKSLTANNQWDVDGLIKSRNSDDGEIINCTATKQPLFYIKKGGAKVMLSAFAKCSDCGNFFHVNYLHTAEGVDKASWPIEFEGTYCKTCWSKE